MCLVCMGFACVCFECGTGSPWRCSVSPVARLAAAGRPAFPLSRNFPCFKEFLAL